MTRKIIKTSAKKVTVKFKSSSGKIISFKATKITRKPSRHRK